MLSRPPNLADLPQRVRDFAAAAPAAFRAWREEVRTDPGLLWRTPGVRITGWVVLGLVGLLAIRWGIGALTSGGVNQAAEKPTPLATLYVACTDPACLGSYTTRQRMDFKSWPLECEKCGKSSVYRATVCPACSSRFATAPGQPARCPSCVARDGQAAGDTSTPKTRGRDDADDP